MVKRKACALAAASLELPGSVRFSCAVPTPRSVLTLAFIADASLGSGPVWSLRDKCAKDSIVNLPRVRGLREKMAQLDRMRLMGQRLLDQAMEGSALADVQFDFGNGSSDTKVGNHYVHLQHVQFDFGNGSSDTKVGNHYVHLQHARALVSAAVLHAVFVLHLAEVVFVLDFALEIDTVQIVEQGHSSVLCSVSRVFDAMFHSGLQEQHTGVVHVKTASRQGFRALLEWMYVQEAGPETAAADGRELWVLAEQHFLPHVHEWLMKHAVCASNAAIVGNFAMVSEGDRSDLLKTCCQYAADQLPMVLECNLRGVGAEVAELFIEGITGMGAGRAHSLQAFKFLQRWCHANDVTQGVDLRRMVKLINIAKLSTSDLEYEVRNSGLLTEAELDTTKAINIGTNVDSRFQQSDTFGGKGPGSLTFSAVHHVAVHGTGDFQVVAATDDLLHRVLVFRVHDGHCLHIIDTTFRSWESTIDPCGMAYNTHGELFVSDYGQDMIRVYDTQGQFVRQIGRLGDNPGDLHGPLGLTFTLKGNLLVCDGSNDRVQELKQDGTFVRQFGSSGLGDGEFQCPNCVAVSLDGHVVVTDFHNARVQVFDEFGVFVRSIGSLGYGTGHFRKPFGVTVFANNSIAVSDWGANRVQVFTWEGQYMQTISLPASSPHGITCDGDGRLFVACNTTRNIVMMSALHRNSRMRKAAARK